uniref:Uncharacterized protein n=1 Tax=Yersinia enterocolitica W22703 TaxID=913028 RepID=F4N5F4_YEREN|nr:unknown protein [Yersinia enterocolitica W22703]
MQVMPPTPGGGPSRLFILRPVATTLFMVAILLAGLSVIAPYRFPPCRKWITPPFRWSHSIPARVRMW